MLSLQFRKNSSGSVRLETRMSRAYTAPPPIKDEVDEEQGVAEVAVKPSVSPVKESAAEEAPAADRGPAGTPSAARRQASFFGRSKTGKAAPSPKHSRRGSQLKVCRSDGAVCVRVSDSTRSSMVCCVAWV